jgi:hypothetical protein
MSTIPATAISGGHEVYLPTTKRWHIARAVESHDGRIKVWFGMSSSATDLPDHSYQVRVPTRNALLAALDRHHARLLAGVAVPTGNDQ